MKYASLPDRDVLIIGAGPAGCELGFRLARAGFDVLIAEQNLLRREKPCGGGLQLREFQEFGAPPHSVIERKILRSRLVSPAGKVLEVALGERGAFAATVKRSIYDGYLQERASRQGAEFLEGARAVKISRQRGAYRIDLRTSAGIARVRAKLAVNAAGSNSTALTERLGIAAPPAEMCVTYHLWLQPEHFPARLRDAFEFYYLTSNPQGYVWIFPKRELLSVGIGATAHSIRVNKINLRQLLEDFVQAHPLAAPLLASCKVVRRGGGIIRFGMLPRLCGPSAIVLGDAAGVANTIHGAGIYHARKSALLAAEPCERFLKTAGQRALHEFSAAAREFFESHEMRWDRKIRRILRHPPTIERVVEKAEKDGRICRALRIILSSTEPHERAYGIFEEKMLEIIYDELSAKSGVFKELVDHRLRTVFTRKTPLHAYANQVLLSSGAKRLRACLGLLASEMFRNRRCDPLSIATVYELFHAASLVHDDIMDHAERRRGKTTLHVKYGLAPAIITGDLMLARCFSLIAEGSVAGSISKEHVLEFLRIVGGAGEACCLGQLLDLEMARKKQYGSIERYLRMITLKTGSLIEGSVKGGTVGSDASPEQIRAVGRMGLNLGIAFQIIDDSLDLLGGSTTNKSVMSDLKQGKATPMLIHALACARGPEKDLLRRAAGNLRIGSALAEDVVAIYRKYSAIAYTQRLTLKYVERARRELLRLPACSARDKFNEILDVLGTWGILGAD